VFLVTGPNSATIPAEKKPEIFAGHMANIGRLGEEDKLLVAGPFGKERTDRTLRGIFILDTPDLETARTWTNTDPGVQAGEFSAEYARFRSPSPLRRSIELYRAEKAEAEKDGKDAPGIRGYAMLFARDGARAGSALRELRDQGHVCFEGALEGSPRGAFLAVLDMEDVRFAEPWLGIPSNPPRDPDVASWYSVATVAAIPRGSP
jgi:uncharacterized protein YciI